MIQPSKHPKLNPLEIPDFLTKHSGGFRRKLEKTRRSNFFQLVPMLKNENFCFLFSMMWLYPVLFSINSRLQKCNFFACTPRMNNSRLSKRAKIVTIHYFIFTNYYTGFRVRILESIHVLFAGRELVNTQPNLMCEVP